MPKVETTKVWKGSDAIVINRSELETYAKDGWIEEASQQEDPRPRRKRKAKEASEETDNEG